MATSYVSFIAVNLLFIAIIWLLEAVGLSNQKAHKIVTYEKIALIRPDRREELLADLRERTGLDIVSTYLAPRGRRPQFAYLLGFFSYL